MRHPALLIACLAPLLAQPPAPQAEIQLWRSATQEILKDSPPVSDPRLDAWLAQVLRRIDPASNRGARLVSSSEVHATAFPQGDVLLTSALLARTANEAELAGVLAHELAHARLGHGRAPDARVRLVFATGLCTRWLKQAPFAHREQWAAWENQADATAVAALRQGGYDPLPMIEFYNKWMTLRGLPTGDLLALRENLEPPPVDLARIDTSEFAELQARFGTRPPDRRRPSLLR
jgi:predicted Zn-dependent protease